MSEWPAAYVGMPYQMLGRARPAVDCWGLVRLVMSEQAKIELPMWDAVGGSDYRLAGQVIADQSETDEWTEVSEQFAKPFDIVTMRSIWRDDGRLRSGEIHCGIMAPGSRVLHIERDTDAVCVPFVKLKRRVTGIYRHRGMK